MPVKQRVDRLLLGTTVAQMGIGLAILASASWLIATERYGRPGSYFFTWQAATGLVGLLALLIAMHVRPHVLSDRRVLTAVMVASWALLAVAFLQAPVAGTHRWLTIGGLSLQPSVLARLALILFAARELAVADREGWPRRRLLTLGLAVGLSTGLIIFGPDLGSSALLVVTVAAMALVAGLPRRVAAVAAAVAVLGLIAAIVTSPYRLQRVRAFFDPDAAAAAAWQSQQSLVAIGNGGLLGVGYGKGNQKLFFLPEPHTDFIYAIAGEELGLAGLVVLLGLAAVIAWRGLRIAHRLLVPEHALLAFGLSFAFAAQSLVHMVVCLNLLPPKGIPLPLVSYGKTDLVVTLASIGLLLGLSREVGE